MLSYSVLNTVNQVSKTFVRYKNPPNHWSVLRKKIQPTDKALEHFDDFYKDVFNEKWPSIREALLTKHKYIAVINNYGDSEKTMAKLESIGALNVRTLFNLEKEYIMEELQKKKRIRELESVWKMDKDIEERLEKNLNNTDPDTLNNKSESLPVSARQFSLQSSLENAEIDERRLVDSKNALSTEILNEFIPTSKIKGREDFIHESAYYKMFDTKASFTVKIEKEYDINFPEHLNVYCYESGPRGKLGDYDSPKKCSTGVLNYYLMDGGSLFPVLALDLKPGCKVLDLCASPGGKSLLALQTLYPDCIVANDVSWSRVKKLEEVFNLFLYDYNERWIKTGRIRVTNEDARDITGADNYDRILLDAPCTTDRHSLKDNVNSIFKTSRIKERLKIPEQQSEMLFNALKLVRPGGIVVYSTCSLSPIQNDGVVHMTLKRIWEETNLEIVVKNLSPALLQTRSVYKMADQTLLKYGHLVLPQKHQNYGPTYFCKLKRIK